MRAAHAVLLSTLLLAAAPGCGESDPGQPGNRGGTGALPATAGTGTMAGATAGTSPTGAMAGTPATTAGTTGATAGMMSTTAGTAGTTAGTTGATAGMMSTMAGTAGTAAGTGGEMPNEGSLFPLATGNTWSFRTTNAGVVSDKTQTIGELEMVGGTGPNSAVMAFYVLTEKDGGADKTESWQAEVDGSVLRYRERAYSASTGELELEEHWDPYKLRVDGTSEHVMTGAMWVEQYTETKLPVGMAPATAASMDSWRVIAENQEVTVPAGTFNALVVEKASGTSTKVYWFVRGIGKVKEQSGAQLEELLSYDVMP